MVDYKNIFVFHPAGLGDAILDLSTLDQLVNASNYTGKIHYVGNIIAKPIIDLSGLPIGIKKHYIKYPFDIKSIIKLLSLRNKIDCHFKRIRTRSLFCPDIRARRCRLSQASP